MLETQRTPVPVPVEGEEEWEACGYGKTVLDGAGQVAWAVDLEAWRQERAVAAAECR